ncbi:DUF2268 domain-containing protein [Bacillus solitudinis]|uniref:DUF2268 domain-containing protein n=1 Tax=Bacillus solitudinis TaxID=2014074 RepID=UPI000C24FA4E|nr:DUF2268 domain-containing protein [Bacillus solitudinis]
MGVVRTNKWIELYTKHWSKERKNEWYMLQQQTFIHPLLQQFQTKDANGLHQYLLEMGLCRPDVDLSETLETFRKKDWWRVIQEHFHLLKEKWSGPEVPIYLFPVELRHEMIRTHLGGKMGLSLPNLILLFIDSNTGVDDVRALLTHEYHHVCRLEVTKETEETITLLESMVMEGLAELAVEDVIGKHALAGWTSHYNQLWKKEWVERWISPHLLLKGREKHFHYLYGSVQLGIPKWLGYYYGFQVVQSAMKNEPNRDTVLWLRCPAKEIFDKSTYL